MPYPDLMNDGELPADILEQYPALEPPPDPNRVTAVWMLGVMILAFVFVLVMAAGQWWQMNRQIIETQPTATLNFVQGCFVQNVGDEPVVIYVAADTGTTIVGRIEPGGVRRVVQQGANWHSIESVVTPDWVQADQVVLIGEGCDL